MTPKEKFEVQTIKTFLSKSGLLRLLEPYYAASINSYLDKLPETNEGKKVDLFQFPSDLSSWIDNYLMDQGNNNLNLMRSLAAILLMPFDRKDIRAGNPFTFIFLANDIYEYFYMINFVDKEEKPDATSITMICRALRKLSICTIKELEPTEEAKE